MQHLCRATAARNPRASTRRRSKHDLHAVVSHCHAVPGQLRALRGVLIEDWIRVVHMDENFARRRKAVEPFEHATWATLRQMADLPCALPRDLEADHLVVAPESAIHEHACS